LKPAEVRKLITAAPTPRDRCIIRLLAESGIRRAELVALDVRDINGKELELTIRSGKGGKQRVVPLTDELAQDLGFLVGRRATGPLFLSLRRGPLTVRQLNRIVHDVGELAGVGNPNPDAQGITPHLFRHTFARQWKDAGGDIETLTNILGHASSATTVDLYGTQSVQDMKESYRRVMDKQERV
jgi:integrase/recombinase XerD